MEVSVEKAPDGNLWLTVRDLDTGLVVCSASGPYTHSRDFLNACCRLQISRDIAQELHERAMLTGAAISAPLSLLSDKPPPQGGGSCSGLKALFRPKTGKMSPAPSGLQEVDGLNHLL